MRNHLLVATVLSLAAFSVSGTARADEMTAWRLSRIAVAGDHVVVTDPLEGKLHLVDAASFARAGEIAVPGKPYNIVSVGGSGRTHEA